MEAWLANHTAQEPGDKDLFHQSDPRGSTEGELTSKHWQGRRLSPR